MLKLIVFAATYVALFSATALAGDTRFWVWDLTVMPPAFRQPTFTEALSAPLSQDRVHVWVEDGLAEKAPTTEQLAKLLPLYTHAIEFERDIFGRQPVSPSGDRDFHILFAAIPPYEKNGHKFGFDGFFNSFDQLTEKTAVTQNQHSNEHDIIYVNALSDVTTDYMIAVVVHELNHLITHGQYDENANPLDPWLNELLGESVMQLDGYFTDSRHVQDYRAAPEQPLAVEQFAISYGGVSLLAEYLMSVAPASLLGRIAPAEGDAFKRLASVYGRSWSALFEGYVSWLFKGDSSFQGAAVTVREQAASMKLAPTGVLYLARSVDSSKLVLSGAPQGCAGSRNMLRSSPVARGSLEAQAVWIESDPPCAVDRGGANFEGFTLTWTP